MNRMQSIGSLNDSDYIEFLGRLQTRFSENIKAGAEPLFTTDAEGLWEAYLNSFSPEQRQHYNCHACRHFINRYAGLVTIDRMGKTAAAVLDSMDGHTEHALTAMLGIVRRAKVTGIFLSSNAVLGEPVTGDWRHIAVALPKSSIYRGPLLTANQKMAERREDYININRALATYPLPVLQTALMILKADALYRSEKVLGPAQWLFDLQTVKSETQDKNRKANIVWGAIAVAPPGFCHPRGSMIGTLLDDLASGLPYADVAAKFKAKMHPLQYQRPTAPPSAGTIKQAEKVMENLGAAGSLHRRFARLEEIPALWKPKQPQVAERSTIFGHLKTKETPEPLPIMNLPQTTITWDKFNRTVLDNAEKIEFYVSSMRENYTALVTAALPDSPPILQWDQLEQRNPVSWYVWHGGAPPSQFGLVSGRFHAVTAVALKPWMWYGNTEGSHQGEGIVFLIEGAKETRQAGNALFPETLKSEFHGIRSVIEAYSRSAEIEGIEEATACGIMLQKGTKWGYLFRVTSKDSVLDYVLDRWD